MAVDDRLRQARRAGAVEHPERMVERHLRERERRVVALVEELLPGRSPPGASASAGIRGRGSGARPCARASGIASEQRPRRRRGGRGRGRRSGSRRRRAAPSARSARSGRRRCGRRSPGEQLDQIAPRLAHARKRDHGLEDVRQVGDDAVAGADSERAEAPRRCARSLVASSPQVSSRAAGAARTHGGSRPSSGSRSRNDVLRVVEPRAREPLRAGHRPRAEHALVRRGRAHVEELPDRRPEALEVGRPTIARGRGSPVGLDARVARRASARSA